MVQAKWKKDEKSEIAPGITSVITWFNRMTNWIVSEVVLTPNLKKRALVIKYFIKLATACYNLNNFNTVMEIVSALDQVSVTRLENTWRLVPKRSIKKFKKCKTMVDKEGNFLLLRNTVIDLVQTGLPCVPYIGYVLQDLLSLEEIETKTQDGNINVNKFRRIGKIIQEFEALKKKTNMISGINKE